MWTRVSCLKSQGLSILNENSQLPEAKHGLDGLFFVESEMKVQGIKRGTESFARSLQTMSGLLREKSSLSTSKLASKCTNADGSAYPSDQTPEDDMRYELKAETLLTSLLREKLYSKEREVEQVQAEVAAAVRGNDILRCELQNAMDDLSCVTHKLKDLEMQMLKKDENINLLQSDIKASTKELTATRRILPKTSEEILPKTSEERERMWEEVKKYNEKNTWLNSEVNTLKKKIETLWTLQTYF